MYIETEFIKVIIFMLSTIVVSSVVNILLAKKLDLKGSFSSFLIFSTFLPAFVNMFAYGFKYYYFQIIGAYAGWLEPLIGLLIVLINVIPIFTLRSLSKPSFSFLNSLPEETSEITVTEYDDIESKSLSKEIVDKSATTLIFVSIIIVSLLGVLYYYS